MRQFSAVVLVVLCAHALFWALVRGEARAPDLRGQLTSVSYAPYKADADVERDPSTSEAQIRADLEKIAPLTQAVRTYSATGGVELVPRIANEFGLKTTIGAWVDKSDERTERELQSIIHLANTERNISGVVVGNETIFRADRTTDELIKMIQRVKRSTSLPVTTGEIWHVWLEHPELVSAVDYIAAHILPYWEGISEKQAVDQAILIYDKLRQAYPGKRIVIAEFGWPSAGYNLKNANPGPLIQAELIRDFVSRADAVGLDYNIVEVIDQPWKTFEGSVGPYWGLYDANRNAKFQWTGPVFKSDHWRMAGLALMVGFLLSLPILVLSGATVTQTAVLATAAQVVGAWTASVVAYWQVHYFVPGAAISFGLGMALLVPLIIIVLAQIDEIAAIAFGRKPWRLLKGPITLNETTPKVSIHIPAYREPPDMLIQTIDSVSRLDYPNFECVVIINNTPEPEFWEPVQRHCEALGERFKFVRADRVEGFKAGALRLALDHTASDAVVIGVLDADYVVDRNWLKDLAPAFADPHVGLVQAPQDHRDADRSLMHAAMNAEYAGFFDIGMVQRNEENAIVVHGTMCLVRREALMEAGGWSSDTICEDTDLGLTILELGWTAHYTNRRYGHGLLPDTFEAFKKQRFRWAYGGMQIVKKHWRRFLPGRSGLTQEQRRAFGLGWMRWLGAESIGVLMATLNLLTVPFIVYDSIAVPDRILTLPIAVSFVVTILHFVSLYRLRCNVPVGQMAGAVVAAMSTQLTMAQAVGKGLVKDGLPFLRTAKGGGKAQGDDFQAFWEAILAAALISCAVLLFVFNTNQIREIYMFAAILVIQSLPFVAAVVIAQLEKSQLNEFGYWRSLGEAWAQWVHGTSVRGAAVPVTVSAAAPVAMLGDAQIEVAQ